MVFIEAIIRGRVCVSVKDMNNDKRYSFQQSINTNIKVADSPGFERGRTMVVNIRNLDAPSSAAFSSKSMGMLKKKSLINHTTIGILIAT